MPRQEMMQGFPPPSAAQATLANWRQAPFSRWAFRNVRALLPTVGIPSGAPSSGLPSAPRSLAALAVTDGAGGTLPLAAFLEATHSDALVVLHKGAVAYEWYDAGMTGRQPHIVFSVTKSVAGLLAGVLADQGKLDPDAPVATLVPEVAGSAYADASIRHLLDMCVGSGFVEDYENPTPEYLRYRESTAWNPSARPEEVDMRSFLATLPPGGPPHGTVFHYVSPNSDLLGWVLERAGGKPFAQMLSEEIWQPMGSSGESYITVDRLGAPRTAGGLCTSPYDLALLGELVRRRGVLDGRQILPGWWLDDLWSAGNRHAWQKGSFAALMPQGNYRSQWYNLGDANGCFCGIGIHGQWLFIDPTAETVIVKLSADPKASDEAADAVVIAAFKAIGAALSD